ncbi:MAG: methyltransferase domain-containing protein [Gallionellaceae bacterium]|nr:methyltransferase domain-containing protein [Gallionellaceae bacterium]
MSGAEFNETEYLAANPDVSVAVKSGSFGSGREHYEKYGKKEGRMLKRLFGRVSREEKVFQLLDKTGLGLEIGPSHNPIAPKKKGFNVHILDHASATELRNKYQGHDINLDSIEEVDFVWHGEPLQELLGKTSCYDWIIASHVIEHVPDVISYLQQCEILLKPDGVLSLVIPDKRYCFDYFRWPSSTGDALQAYMEHRTRHTPGTVFDHFSNAAKMGGMPAWASQLHGEMSFIHTLDNAQAAWKQAQESDEYIDIHGWRFTPSSFRLILHDLQRLNLTGMVEVGGFDTEGCEFFIALGKRQEKLLKGDRIKLAQSMVQEIADCASSIL